MTEPTLHLIQEIVREAFEQANAEVMPRAWDQYRQFSPADLKAMYDALPETDWLISAMSDILAEHVAQQGTEAFQREFASQGGLVDQLLRKKILERQLFVTAKTGTRPPLWSEIPEDDRMGFVPTWFNVGDLSEHARGKVTRILDQDAAERMYAEAYWQAYEVFGQYEEARAVAAEKFGVSESTIDRAKRRFPSRC